MLIHHNSHLLIFGHSTDPCKNKAKTGEYFNGGCETAKCTNAQKGQYYTGPAPSGSKDCPVATCTNKLHVGQYFTTSGGTNPTGCQFTGLFA